MKKTSSIRWKTCTRIRRTLWCIIRISANFIFGFSLITRIWYILRPQCWMWSIFEYEMRWYIYKLEGNIRLWVFRCITFSKLFHLRHLLWWNVSNIWRDNFLYNFDVKRWLRKVQISAKIDYICRHHSIVLRSNRKYRNEDKRKETSTKIEWRNKGELWRHLFCLNSINPPIFSEERSQKVFKLYVLRVA